MKEIKIIEPKHQAMPAKTTGQGVAPLSSCHTRRSTAPPSFLHFSDSKNKNCLLVAENHKYYSVITIVIPHSQGGPSSWHSQRYSNYSACSNIFNLDPCFMLALSILILPSNVSVSFSSYDEVEKNNSQGFESF